MSASAYPLQWPEGWPRTPNGRHQDSKHRFKRPGRKNPFWTFSEARDELGDELDRMGARNVVLSSNYELRLDGLPRGNQSRPDDTGVAVYFTLKGIQKVMACDMHVRAEENMRSIALALDAMRALERHGGGVMMERAFEGFTALPGPNARRPWRDVLGFHGVQLPNKGEIDAAWRDKAKKAHPDAGGSDAAMSALNAARDEALKAVA